MISDQHTSGQLNLARNKLEMFSERLQANSRRWMNCRASPG